MAEESLQDNKDDKLIFDELKELIFEGDWESLLMKFIEYKNNFPIDFQDSENNYTLVHYAASKGQVDCLRVLIMELSAQPDIKANNGYTPIHLLVSSDCRCKSCINKILQCLQILVDGGANVDEEDDLGESPLYGAARNRLSDPASFLLANGANINHWVNGTSVATILAQYVPDVLKAEFDKCILIDTKKGIHRSLRLNFSEKAGDQTIVLETFFMSNNVINQESCTMKLKYKRERLLLQEVATTEGFSVKLPKSSPILKRRGIVSPRRANLRQNVSKMESNVRISKRYKETSRFLNNVTASVDSSSASSLSTTASFNSHTNIPPKETELLNYLLKADFAAAEAVVNHPLVEAFVHLKWLSVKKLFFLLKSFYFFLISLYTFYVFETFVNATCYYNRGSIESPVSASGLPSPPSMNISGEGVENQLNVITLRNGSMSWNESVFEREAEFGSYLPASSSHERTSAKLTGNSAGIKTHNFYYWHSFSEYFKAHEMICEPSLRTQIMAYILSSYVVVLVLYELYKCFESWYDYWRSPLSLAWWVLAINIGVTVIPGLGIYAHTWQYPYAAFSLVFGWIFVLAQVERIPYFGALVGVFVKVLKDFIILLFTFSPVLLAFSLGFSVLLPQHEFFRSLPSSFFKVFLMMTGDVDFWGVFRGTWTTAEHQGHVYIPLFIIYTGYILTVTMVLMSLLMGLAVDNIQEVRREAAVHRTIRLIKEIGIFESLLHMPAVYYCGFARYFRRLFSITSLKCMNGPELVIYPEDLQDQALPTEIKQKLIPYLVNTCCSSEFQKRKQSRCNKVGGKGNSIRKRWNTKVINQTETSEKQSDHLSEKYNCTTNNKIIAEVGADIKTNTKDLRRSFFENLTTPGEDANLVNIEVREDYHTSSETQQLKDKLLQRDLLFFQEMKLLLEDNERIQNRIEALKYKLLHNGE